MARASRAAENALAYPGHEVALELHREKTARTVGQRGDAARSAGGVRHRHERARVSHAPGIRELLAQHQPGNGFFGGNAPTKAFTIAHVNSSSSAVTKTITTFTGATDLLASDAVIEGSNVVVSRAVKIANNWRFALARYGFTGTIDGTFGTAGKVNSPFPNAQTATGHLTGAGGLVIDTANANRILVGGGYLVN
jgi:hypothetical protein